MDQTIPRQNVPARKTPRLNIFKIAREIAPSTFTHGLAGAGAGAIASFVTCPLDVIKTVLQVQRQIPGTELKYKGVYGTMSTILAEEGIRGLYKGLGTTLMALIPNWAVYFYTYNTAKEIGIKSGFHDGPLLHMSTAMAAAALTDVVTTPLWMIKTRLQTQKLTENSHKYTNTFGALRVIVREEGLMALWKGLTPQLFGIAHVAVQFPLYEHMKYKLAHRKGKTKDELGALELILASAVSKVTASVAAYPHEVLRSRFQFQHSSDPQRYSSMWNAITRIFRQEGVRGFYRGMAANLLRVTPSCAITFTSYELLVRAMKS